LHWNLPGPASRERLRVIDGEFIEQRIRIGTRETFNEMQVLSRTSEVRFVGKIRGVDDERISFPMSTRVSHPLLDSLWKMRSSIHRNDARVVDLLVKDDDVSRCLYQLIVIVVAGRRHRRA